MHFLNAGNSAASSGIDPKRDSAAYPPPKQNPGACCSSRRPAAANRPLPRRSETRPAVPRSSSTWVACSVRWSDSRKRTSVKHCGSSDAMAPAVCFLDEVEKAFSGVSASGPRELPICGLRYRYACMVRKMFWPCFSTEVISGAMFASIIRAFTLCILCRFMHESWAEVGKRGSKLNIQSWGRGRYGGDQNKVQ